MLSSNRQTVPLGLRVCVSRCWELGSGEVISAHWCKAVWWLKLHVSDRAPGWGFILLPDVLFVQIDVFIHLCQNYISKWFYTQVVHYPKKSITNLWLVKGSPLPRPFLGLTSPWRHDPTENVKVVQLIIAVPVCSLMVLRRNWSYFEGISNKDSSAFS